MFLYLQSLLLDQRIKMAKNTVILMDGILNQHVLIVLISAKKFIKIQTYLQNGCIGHLLNNQSALMLLISSLYVIHKHALPHGRACPKICGSDTVLDNIEQMHRIKLAAVKTSAQLGYELLTYRNIRDSIVRSGKSQSERCIAA